MEATQLLHHPGLEFWQVFHIKPYYLMALSINEEYGLGKADYSCLISRILTSYKSPSCHPSAKSMGSLELGFSQPECSALTTTLWDTPVVVVNHRTEVRTCPCNRVSLVICLILDAMLWSGQQLGF